MELHLVNLFRRSAQRGYLYIPDENPIASPPAAPGEVVRIPGRKPPWLVVDHALVTVIVARWPGRLWLVEIVDPITAREQSTSGRSLGKDPPYTRAAAVKIIEEVGVAVLFGERGAAVTAVADVAKALTEDLAWRLVQAREVEAGQARARVWHRWHEQRGQVVDDTANFEDVLAVSSLTAGTESPIGKGLIVVNDVVIQRARSLVGASALTDDPNDPEGAQLAQPWAGASAALCDAAIAFGRPELTAEADHRLLTNAWTAAVSTQPPGS